MAEVHGHFAYTKHSRAGGSRRHDDFKSTFEQIFPFSNHKRISITKVKTLILFLGQFCAAGLTSLFASFVFCHAQFFVQSRPFYIVTFLTALAQIPWTKLVTQLQNSKFKDDKKKTTGGHWEEGSTQRAWTCKQTHGRRHTWREG